MSGCQVGLPKSGSGGLSPPGEQVPVVDERVLHVPDDVAGKPGVGVAPVGGVEAADVVAADERDRRRRPPAACGGHDRCCAGTGSRDAISGCRRTAMFWRQHEEAARHDQVGELVEDDVDLHAAVGRLDQRVLERLADLVALPDEGLEEDLATWPAGSRPACRGRGPRRRCRPSPPSRRRSPIAVAPGEDRRRARPRLRR